MTDYQSIVDEIRYTIQSEDCELTDSLREANVQYAEACREVNRRLRRVSELLSAGLRSEAIQFGEGPPNLVDVVTILTFPEAEEWSGVVTLYDMPPAEQLNSEVVEQLIEAQFLEQPLRKLLARHRRLAITRAPLRIRLAVLRELKEADPETFTWEEDVREFERARFAEIAIAAKQAHQNGDKENLNQIYEEITSGEWLEDAPAKLITAVRKSLAGMSRQSAREEIQQLATELDEAFSELDLDRARMLRARWLEAKKSANLPAGDPIFEQLAPVLGWIDDENEREANEQKYDQTIAQLERALDSNASIEELERLDNEINRLERSLPDLLATRLENRFGTLQLAETRSHRLKLGTAITALVVLVGFVGLLVFRQMRSNEVATLAAHVEQLLNDRQYEQAQTALENRSDAVRWENLQALQTRLNNEVQDEQERSKRLDQQFALVEAADSYTVAIAALDKARPYVLSIDDELKFDRLKRDWESRHDEQMATQQKLIQSGIQNITASLLQADKEIAENPDKKEIATVLQESSVKLSQLQIQAKELQPEITSQIKLLMSRRQQLEDLRSKRLNVTKARHNVTKLALIAQSSQNAQAAVKNYHDALIKYAETLETDSNADSIRKSAKETAFWEAALEWSKVTRDWPQVWPTGSSPAKLRAQSCEAYLKKHPGAPDAQLISAYLLQLSAIQERLPVVGETDPKLKDRLQRIFDTPLIKDSWCLRTKDGKTYYLPKKKKFSDKLFKFDHFVGYSADELTECGDVRPDELRAFETVQAPCSEVSLWVKRQLPSVDTKTWNTFCHDLAVKLVATENMNPFLKWDLLRRTLEAAGEGDVFLKKALEDHVTLLQEAPISPLARWMDPDDLEGKKATEAASQVLVTFQKLESLGDMWKSAAKAESQQAINLKAQTTMIGWLRKQDSNWTCETDWNAKGTWDLHVVFVNETQTASQWRLIGEAQGGAIEIKKTASSFLSQGRPVFATQQATTKVVQQ